MRVNFTALLLSVLIAANVHAEDVLRVATFNVSMESTNYLDSKGTPSSEVLATELASGTNSQIKNIAEIIQRVNPDIMLLNEFDLLPQATGVEAFQNNYLAVSQQGQAPISFPYFYINTVNTGMPTPFDLDNNGSKESYGGDAYGFGLYEGQYAMVVLSKYPIEKEQIRTLQYFKWKDMPGAQAPISPATKTPWYNEEEWANFRLSSKSHWDIPVNVNGKTVHVLAMHPTPPTFDGDEDRNGKRNHDEIRLMADYLTPGNNAYIYDDNGVKGGMSKATRFVLVGDFNAADMGDKHRPDVIEQLTHSPLVNSSVVPVSEGGSESSEASFSDRFTAYWGARADYVLPSRYGFEVKDAGVFWPAKQDPLYRLVKDRKASSDHRLVWTDLVITTK